MENGQRTRALHTLPHNSSKSINWFAPELLEQNLLGYTITSDIYSVGITSCELANGIAPFADLSSTLMLTEKLRGNQPSLLDGSTVPSDELIAQALDSGIEIGDNMRQVYSSRQLTDHFHKFAEVCLTHYPENRPSASWLLAHHAFFKQCKHTSLEEQLRTVLEPVDYDNITAETENLAENPSSSVDLSRDFEALKVDAEWEF